MNPYTVIYLENDNTLSHKPYATAFQTQLAPIISAVNSLIESIEALKCDDHGFLDFLKHFVTCYQSTDVDTLVALNTELDRKWMHTNYSLEFIHDIEEGYCGN